MEADADQQHGPGTLDVFHPATGQVVGQVSTTSPDDVHEAVERSKRAQVEWSRKSWPERKAVLRNLWAILSSDADGWADLIRDEIGKPRSETLGEVMMGLDGIRWTVKKGHIALREEWFGAGWQRALLISGGRLGHRPLGVIGIIGTWNYPFFLNAPAIAQALAAGNGVVWKPSELALRCGQRLQAAMDRAGFPEGLVSAVYGGAEVGKALTDANIQKGVFTGGLESGRHVLQTLAGRGIPAIAELSGFDPAIVLDDAPLESTARALAWGAFVGTGQTCVAVKRIYVVGDPAPWVEKVAGIARSLRVGNPSIDVVDLGPMISRMARDRFHQRIGRAIEVGATLVCGGESLPGEGSFYAPTVLTSTIDGVEPILEGVFGPVVLIRGMPDVNSAIHAANASAFGLAASVWGKNWRRLRGVAQHLEAGQVTFNDVVTPSGNASAPFGGTKASGFGRIHGIAGLREFTTPQAILGRRAGGFRPQVFPYRPGVEKLLTWYRRFFHPSA
ncbi:aldehyde dehydrogenase family protein [Singulisphaera sp. PoT]|uniref:aldehyde dehydrogenase family protein n=1 Tax=Singulisphaera sp. PoT TaxID=3411797 RepID=UPI003BF5F27A